VCVCVCVCVCNLHEAVDECHFMVGLNEQCANASKYIWACFD